MTPLAVSFRGQRNYIHSVDLCNAIIGCVFPKVMTEGAIFAGRLSVKFLRPLNTIPFLEISSAFKGSEHDSNVVATFHANDDATSAHGHLIASGETVSQRIEVDENRISKLLVDSDGTANFRADSSISIQEAIVIGARRLLEMHDSSDENFRWAVAWINFDTIPLSLRSPHASLERLALKRGSGQAGKFWSLEISWDDRPVGEIILQHIRR